MVCVVDRAIASAYPPKIRSARRSIHVRGVCAIHEATYETVHSHRNPRLRKNHHHPRARKRRDYSTVPEAATDVIAQEAKRGNSAPWRRPDFIDMIIALQKQRQIETADNGGAAQFHDRSPVCTYALSVFLGFAAISMRCLRRRRG